MLKVAVIGVGSMGRSHARVYSLLPEVDLVGVADIDSEAAATIAKRHGGRPYSDYRQMLDELRPDALTIATPTAQHLPVALEVMKRGIHLLIEKPIAHRIEDAEQIIAAAQKAGLHLMIGHIERFNPAVVALKQRLLNGELGRVFQIDARRQGPFPSRVQDVGVVIDLAVHDLDVMRYISQAEIVRVYAETARHVHEAHEDLLSALVRLEGGIVGALTINWLTPTKIRELYVTGEKGMFRVDYLTQDLYFFENAVAERETWDTLSILRGVSEGKMIRYVVPKKEPLRAELEAFVGALREESPAPVKGVDALKVLKLAQAIIASGLEKQVIQISL